MEHVLIKPDDFHIHLRQGKELVNYARDASKSFARVLAMPNTIPPVTSPEDIKRYASHIKKAAPSLDLIPVFKIMPDMKEQDITLLKKAGAIAGKYYPRGATTNAEDGAKDVESVFPALAAMEKIGLVLCFHGEEPSASVLDRERAFFPVVEKIHKNFPSLKMVFEHVSDKATIDFVHSFPDNIMAATVTLHHLLFTLDDLMGGGLNPHLFCKPVVKTKADRDAIREVVFSGNSRFFFGSDSAPHNMEKKLAGAAGVYTAPYAVEALATLFYNNGVLEKLEGFTSVYGADFYGLPRNKGTICLVRREWIVPEKYGDIVSACSGMKLEWKISQ
ncbi:dihydroorotase [Spirochaetia bacterium 38H-sp]|uniref:Dihydroorotase n=1 Tax=Rarispira pelagica TaxID=3141764 RepID=A0ABU9U926_9SPIR